MQCGVTFRLNHIQGNKGCLARQTTVSFSPLFSLRNTRGLLILTMLGPGRDLQVAQLFCRLDLNPASSPSLQQFLPDFVIPHSTPFTTVVPTGPSNRPPRNGVPSPVDLPTLRAERTALLVSSTSWTADEDFKLLLEALEIYNRVASAKGGEKGLPRILVMITGKGPLKDTYMGEIQRLQCAWDFVRCISTWLDAADYPLLLGCYFFSFP